MAGGYFFHGQAEKNFRARGVPVDDIPDFFVHRGKRFPPHEFQFRGRTGGDVSTRSVLGFLSQAAPVLFLVLLGRGGGGLSGLLLQDAALGLLVLLHGQAVIGSKGFQEIIPVVFDGVLVGVTNVALHVGITAHFVKSDDDFQDRFLRSARLRQQVDEGLHFRRFRDDQRFLGDRFDDGGRLQAFGLPKSKSRVAAADLPCRDFKRRLRTLVDPVHRRLDLGNDVSGVAFLHGDFFGKFDGIDFPGVAAVEGLAENLVKPCSKRGMELFELGKIDVFEEPFSQHHFDKLRGKVDFEVFRFLVDFPTVDHAEVNGLIGFSVVKGAGELDADHFPAFEAVGQAFIRLGIHLQAATVEDLVTADVDYLGVIGLLALEQEIEKEDDIRFHRGFVAAPVNITFNIFPDETVFAGGSQFFVLEPQRVFEKVDTVTDHLFPGRHAVPPILIFYKIKKFHSRRSFAT